MKRRTWLAAASSSALLPTQIAHAQSFPSRPIRLIVPFAPGGSVDAIARAISDALARQLGQPVVIENRGGAGGTIGTMEMIRSAPDGHTLAAVSPSVTAANPAINPKVPYDPINDWTPIINIAASPTVVCVNPSFPAKNYPEFLAELKRRPGRYSYASSGVGGILHLQLEYFKSVTGTFITHIPYRGAGPAVADVIAGQVAIAYDSFPSVLGFVREGRLVPIVVCAPQRTKELPQVPTFPEVGVPGLSKMPHFGLLGPRGMPKDIVATLNAATRKVLEDPVVRKRIEDTGTVIIGSTPEEFGAEIKGEYEKLKAVVAERKLALE